MEEKTGQLVSAGAFQFCQLPSGSHGLRRLGAVNDVLHLVGRFGDELSGGSFGRLLLLRCHLRHARRSSDVCWLKDGTYMQRLDPKPSNDACMSGDSASRHGRTTMVLIIATAAWGYFEKGSI
jgi:hypothetical protein